jgi:hypothetical protein
VALSVEHLLLRASPATREIDRPIGRDRDHNALSSADAALALAGCRTLAYAAVRWRVNGDVCALSVLRPALDEFIQTHKRCAHAHEHVATLALIAERRHVADELARAVLAADLDDRHWFRCVRPLYGRATWQLEAWCGEGLAVVRDHVEE